MFIRGKFEWKMNAEKRAYKTLGNRGLFDMEENKSKLTSLGNPLERLPEAVDFEMFRGTLETGLYKERMTNARARPYDPVLMFKVLVLQRMYNLSDEQTEYQTIDRMSFRNFLGLASGDKVPDARTIRAFKDQLVKKNIFDLLFSDFDRFLKERNLILNQGVIIDGSFVEVPCQRNSRGENKAIKAGHGNELWSGDREKNNRRNSKTRARVEHVFGYCEQSLRGMYSRVVGFARNATLNTLTDLVYNVCRYEQVKTAWTELTI